MNSVHYGLFVSLSVFCVSLEFDCRMDGKPRGMRNGLGYERERERSRLKRLLDLLL